MVTVKETRRSRSRTLETETREYIAWGSSDPNEVDTAVDAFDAGNSPPVGLVVTDYSLEPREEDESVFDARFTYGPYTPNTPTETGGNDLSFQLSLVTSHITTPLERIATFATNPFVPVMHGIGFDGDKFQGTDIQIPVFSWNETHYRSTASVNTTYINQIFTAASNPINDATFRGFSAGEVMYLGAQGSQRSSADFAITHSFAASPNLSDLTIGDIEDIAKSGWDYLWVLYEKAEDDSNKFITEKPRAVYVDRVYNSSNLATLLEI
jgi:hypothetical protein